LKGLQNAGVVQTEGGLPRQTQTYAHRGTISNGVSDGRNKEVETLAYLIPTFTCMDIRAVGEMGLGGKPCQLHVFRCVVSAKL
jgi:hypothetical protein